MAPIPAAWGDLKQFAWIAYEGEAMEGSQETESNDLTLAGSDTPCLHYVVADILAGTPTCKVLAQRLFRAIDKYKALGLAAPQLGVASAMAVVNIPAANVRFCMVNPIVKRLFGKEGVAVEECLTLPGVRAMKLRREMVEVIFQDENGKTHRVITGGLLSRVIQHEIAHLRGLLITDGTVKAAPLRNINDEPKQETQPLGSDNDGAVREVGQADVASQLPPVNEKASA